MFIFKRFFVRRRNKRSLLVVSGRHNNNIITMKVSCIFVIIIKVKALHRKFYFYFKLNEDYNNVKSLKRCYIVLKSNMRVYLWERAKNFFLMHILFVAYLNLSLLYTWNIFRFLNWNFVTKKGSIFAVAPVWV